MAHCRGVSEPAAGSGSRSIVGGAARSPPRAKARRGIAIAIGISTLVIALGLMWAISPRTLAIAVVGLSRLALAVGGAAVLAFGGLSLALSPAVAAVAGVAVYALVIIALRSLGLSAAWSYVRGLH